MIRLSHHVLVVVILTGAVRLAAAQNSLASVRDLYAAAEYEQALALLNSLPAGEKDGDERRSIEQYRAFCLLALGRPDDAQRSIEAIVSAEPSYQPPESEVPPRIRGAFHEVRARMLPSIVQERYNGAKSAFDRKEFVAAADGFGEVLSLLQDPAVKARAEAPPLADISKLAAGFHQLSLLAAAPPPPEPAPEEPRTPPPALVAPVADAPGRLYGPEDKDVQAPGIVRQWLPPVPSGSGVRRGRGHIEVIISETGVVESAKMRTPIDPIYDRLLLAAASTWEYRPAERNGAPVKYRKLVQVTVVEP
jgi:hypothetical protein